MFLAQISIPLLVLIFLFIFGTFLKFWGYPEIQDDCYLTIITLLTRHMMSSPLFADLKGNTFKHSYNILQVSLP